MQPILAIKTVSMDLCEVSAPHQIFGRHSLPGYKAAINFVVSDDLVVYQFPTWCQFAFTHAKLWHRQLSNLFKAFGYVTLLHGLAHAHALSGVVEVDEAFLDCVNNKESIAVAAGKRGKATGRIRFQHIKSREGAEIQNCITETIVPGSTIVSDRYKGYPTIVEKGYIHSPQKTPYS